MSEEKKLDDVLVTNEKHEYRISLSKLIGKNVKDIRITFRKYGNDIAAIIHDIALEDGSELDVGVVFDEAYVSPYEEMEGLDDATVKRLYEESRKREEGE
jgi:uncharacterized protein YpiB (UPF0302 family)